MNINGRTITGNNIVMVGGKITVDGKRIDLENKDEKIINIEIQGDVNNLEIDYCKNINIVGNVNSIDSASGNIKVSGVSESVKSTSGDIDVNGDVGGDINTKSGDVECKNVKGKVKTISGDVTHER